MIWTYIRVEYKLIYRHYATTFSVASLWASGSGFRWLGNRSCSWTTCRLSRCFEGSKACCHWLSRADSNALWVFSRILLDRHESHPDVCFGVDHLISECCETNRWKAFEPVVWRAMFDHVSQEWSFHWYLLLWSHLHDTASAPEVFLSVFAGKTPHWFSVGTEPGLV
jgi:hypothetical protein